MPTKVLFSCYLVFALVYANAQDFSFSPGQDYYGTLEMDVYTENYVYVYPNATDTTLITWRRIDNTCPTEWDFQMCDFQQCYDGFPNTSEMSPLPPNGVGNLRLIVNPFNVPGNGIVHFLVYPTGFPELAQDVIYHFETTVTSVLEEKSNAQCFLQSNQLCIVGENGMAFIRDVHGKVVSSFRCNAAFNSFDISHLPSGVFIASIQNRVFRFCKL
jgi:hypothetical protein